jgi:hypothetical protein
MYCFLLVILRCPFFSLLWFSKLRMEGGDLLQLGRPAMVHRSSVQGIYYGVDTGLSACIQKAGAGHREEHATCMLVTDGIESSTLVLTPSPYLYPLHFMAQVQGVRWRGKETKGKKKKTTHSVFVLSKNMD